MLVDHKIWVFLLATTCRLFTLKVFDIVDYLIFFADSYLASDLSLQVILYFNAYYSGFWMLICIVTFIAKVRSNCLMFIIQPRVQSMALAHPRNS